MIIMKYTACLLFVFIPFMGFSQSPGGISTNIQLWLKADDGVLNSGSSATDGQAVNTWQDKTTVRTNDATDANLAPPSFRDNSADYINYNPVVDFDGVNDGLDFGNDYIYSTGTGSQDGMTWFAVVEPDNAPVDKDVQHIIDFGSMGSKGYGFRYGPSIYAMHTSSINSGAAGKITHSFGTKANLVRFTVDFSTNQTINVNGAPATLTHAIGITALSAAEIYENPTHLNNAGPFTVGHQSKASFVNNDNGRRLDGSIAELIGFSADLSETSGADISRIESYLSIKYGLTRDNSTGTTAGDYFESSGSNLWDASLTPSFHNDVIGIGRDDNSDLIQNQSHQLDDSTRIYLSTLNISNSGNTGSFSTNSQFLLMGHNSDALKSLGSSEFPSAIGIYSRIEREWKITNTNFNGNFSLDITLNTNPLTASDLRLLVDTDHDLSDGTLYNPTISVSGNTVTISGLSNTEIPINSTSYFTIVSIDSNTPLPLALVEFTAIPVNNNYVQLDWQTATEVNNDYFTIERSQNATKWEEIKTIDGGGNSLSNLSYSDVDNEPYTGSSYYRIKQTDFEGQSEYSEVIEININDVGSTQINVYPNPATDQITIEGSKDELESITVYNALGQDVTSMAQQQVLGYGSIVLILLSALGAGIYYVKTKTTIKKIVKK